MTVYLTHLIAISHVLEDGKQMSQIRQSTLKVTIAGTGMLHGGVTMNRSHSHMERTRKILEIFLYFFQ
jgi:hypothetical protein